MIHLKVECPHCKRSLLDTEQAKDDCPAVRVTITYKEKKGDLLLSSLYGSYNHTQPFSIPSGDTVSFSCPWCHASLMSTTPCTRCNAYMVSLAIAEGGGIQICSRQGCKKHILEFEDLETDLKAFYRVYSTSFNE